MTYFETLTTVRTTDGHVERTQKQYEDLDNAKRSSYTRMSQFMDGTVYESVVSRVSDTLENEFIKNVWVKEKPIEETKEDKTSASASTTTTEKASTT